MEGAPKRNVPVTVRRVRFDRMTVRVQPQDSIVALRRHLRELPRREREELEQHFDAVLGALLTAQIAEWKVNHG